MGPVTTAPRVDVIIPAAGPAHSLPGAIRAVLEQDYPNLGQVVVAAHGEETARLASAAGARVVPNPTGRTPSGLNIAIAATEAEIVARVDAHAVIPPGYVTRAVSTLISTKADVVGGMQVPVGKTGWEKAIAAAMASPFGAGDARYRVGGAPGPADTVYLGVFRRETLERLGGYDEDFTRNQDYELNHRIREAGGVVWFDPELKVVYRPRGSLSLLARQYFAYGRWKRQFARRHPGSLRARQLAPPIAVVALSVGLVGSLWWPPLALIPLAYAVALTIVGLSHIRRLGIPALGVPLALAAMHISWGLGFLSPPTDFDRTPEPLPPAS
jgi:glycosyltransferase involved in cell wall biosynthesis